MENNFKGEPEVKWSSFMPALGYALGSSDGMVVELGMGHFSSPFLHEYCKATFRFLTSVEENAIWGEMFRNLGGGSHRVEISRYGEVLDSLRARGVDVGVTFIDSSPGGQARADLFAKAIEFSKFVVVHDYHRENKEAIEPLLDGCNYRVFEDYDPPTLVATKKK